MSPVRTYLPVTTYLINNDPKKAASASEAGDYCRGAEGRRKTGCSAQQPGLISAGDHPRNRTGDAIRVGCGFSSIAQGMHALGREPDGSSSTTRKHGLFLSQRHGVQPECSSCLMFCRCIRYNSGCCCRQMVRGQRVRLEVHVYEIHVHTLPVLVRVSKYNQVLVGIYLPVGFNCFSAVTSLKSWGDIPGEERQTTTSTNSSCSGMRAVLARIASVVLSSCHPRMNTGRSNLAAPLKTY